MKSRTRSFILTVSLLLLPSMWISSAARAEETDPSILQVLVGRSIVVNSQETLKRVSVTDPTIASAMIVSPNQVLIHGQTPGSVTLLLWDDQEHSRSYSLDVTVDTKILQRTILDLFPAEKISLTPSGAGLVLTGSVSSKAVGDRAAALVQTQTKNVINMLQFTDDRNVVSLQVRFAEVDRSAIRELAANIFSTGAANTIGTISTQQFGSMAGNVGAIPSTVTRGRDPQTPSLASGGIGNPLNGTPAVFGLTDLLNIFIFRPDLNLGATLKLLQQRNLLEILAEPNLLALNGAESSFLAGGEFPFPVLQGGTTFNAVTIQFKEFGVRLKFRPLIQSDGTIRLKVAPEVSSLDFSNALTVSGFVVPALSTRRAETEVELKDGQSFAIAGLLDDRVTKIGSKVAGLGDIPIIGKLFQSESRNKNHTELLVVVTPRLVRPLNPGEVPPGPRFPEPFLDPTRSQAPAPARRSSGDTDNAVAGDKTGGAENAVVPDGDNAARKPKNGGKGSASKPMLDSIFHRK